MIACRPFTPRQRVAVARAALGIALGAPLASSCAGRTDDFGVTGSETHFLIKCSETCASGLECIRGACTLPCTGDEACASLSSAAVCSVEPTTDGRRACDAPCGTAADCAVLGSGYGCQAGACRGTALSVGVEASGAEAPGAEALGAIPDTFELMEFRRYGETPAGPGSNCDPLAYTQVIFVDLVASLVSWQYCNNERGSDVFVGSAGQWPLVAADRADVLAAYGRLRVTADDTCFFQASMLTLDVTTATSERFRYADAEHAGCPFERLGRAQFVGDMTELYGTLAPLLVDRPRGLPSDGSRDP